MSEHVPIEGNFGLKRDEETPPLRFSLRSTKDIPVGIEGQKFIADVESRRGKHGSFFFKSVPRAEVAQKQKEKHTYLKEHGARVPEIFKPSEFENGAPMLIVSDLGENGRYAVVGMNNPEVNTSEFKSLVLRISPETRKRIITELITDCEAAAGLFDEDGQSKNPIYEYQNNAFIMAINPDDPNDINVFVADLGIDVTEEGRVNQEKVVERNIFHAAAFYSWMTGEVFKIPTDSKFTYLQERISKDNRKMLDYRGFH